MSVFLYLVALTVGIVGLAMSATPGMQDMGYAPGLWWLSAMFFVGTVGSLPAQWLWRRWRTPLPREHPESIVKPAPRLGMKFFPREPFIERDPTVDVPVIFYRLGITNPSETAVSRVQTVVKRCRPPDGFRVDSPLGVKDATAAESVQGVGIIPGGIRYPQVVFVMNDHHGVPNVRAAYVYRGQYDTPLRAGQYRLTITAASESGVSVTRDMLLTVRDDPGNPVTIKLDPE